jgi:hypothetical protein
MNIASHVCDPKLVARLLGVRSIVNYHFFRLSEAPLEQAEIHRFHAMMLMDRAPPPVIAKERAGYSVRRERLTGRSECAPIARLRRPSSTRALACVPTRRSLSPSSRICGEPRLLKSYERRQAEHTYPLCSHFSRLRCRHANFCAASFHALFVTAY